MLGELDSAESDGEAGKYWIFGLNLMEGRLPAKRRVGHRDGCHIARLFRPVLSDCCPTVPPRF